MLIDGCKKGQSSNTISKRYRLTVDNEKESGVMGCALGPEWASAADISGALNVCYSFYVYKSYWLYRTVSVP